MISYKCYSPFGASPDVTTSTLKGWESKELNTGYSMVCEGERGPLAGGRRSNQVGYPTLLCQWLRVWRGDWCSMGGELWCWPMLLLTTVTLLWPMRGCSQHEICIWHQSQCCRNRHCAESSPTFPCKHEWSWLVPTCHRSPLLQWAIADGVIPAQLHHQKVTSMQ